MSELKQSIGDLEDSIDRVKSGEGLRVQCLAAEIEILKRTISELQFQIQASQSITDLAESLEKAASDTLTNQNEFEWVEPVHMYYHSSTGYYFDDLSCLFFNPSRDCYLKYNPRTWQYVEIKTQKQEYISEELSKSQAMDDDSQTISHNGVKVEPKEEANQLEDSAASTYLYDSASGYYYNPATQMFFEPLSRRYFKYDAATQTHEEVSEHGQPLIQKCSLGNRCVDITDSCVRLIVIQSELKEFPKGSLFVVTKNESNPWLGTDKSCVVMIPQTDQEVERFHCKMKLNEDQKCWQIRTGKSTYKATVNGKELSSDWSNFSHGMLLVVGSITFSVHIHSGDGNDTCDGCEPAVVQAFYSRVSGKRKSEEEKHEMEGAEKELTVEQKRRMINKLMKQEMGLHAKGSISCSGGEYKDRAAERRQEVGSEPSIGYSVGGSYQSASPSSAGNQSSSLDMPVRRDNIGYKLLAQMGYRDGEGLGVSGQGIVEPVRMEIREHRAGLSETQPKFSIDEQEKAEKYKRQWSKAAKRFSELS